MNKEIMYKFYRTKTGKICRYEVDSNGTLERKRAKAKMRGDKTQERITEGIKQTNEHGEEKAGDIYLNLYNAKSSKQEIDRQIRKRMARSYRNKKTKTIAMWRGNYKEYGKK